MKTSVPPSVGWMKPKPFVALTISLVPAAIAIFPRGSFSGAAPARERRGLVSGRLRVRVMSDEPRMQLQRMRFFVMRRGINTRNEVVGFG
jgi:hypothetical protein